MSRILVVDDTASHCQMVAKMLGKHGFEVLLASDADQGMEIAENQAPDLILMDIVMPGIDGFEATRALTKNSKTAHIPVVLLSSKQAKYDKAWGLRQGARAYLGKPVEEKDLLRTVRETLGR